MKAQENYKSFSVSRCLQLPFVSSNSLRPTVVEAAGFHATLMQACLQQQCIQLWTTDCCFNRSWRRQWRCQ